MIPYPVNDTMRKFGYPDNSISESGHWVVLIRPEQVTLGSLVLVCREPVAAFAEISEGGFAELRPVIQKIETVLRAAIDYQKINYLMLMMLDSDVHFHVFPRYEGKRNLHGLSVSDAGWPGQPRLDQAVTPDKDTVASLVAGLRRLWLEN